MLCFAFACCRIRSQLIVFLSVQCGQQNQVQVEEDTRAEQIHPDEAPDPQKTVQQACR